LVDKYFVFWIEFVEILNEIRVLGDRAHIISYTQINNKFLRHFEWSSNKDFNFINIRH